MSHQWCKCRNSFVKGGCNVKTHWAFVAPGLKAGQADYDNCKGPDYSMYGEYRNPVDFTPKAVYDEMDRQAKAMRRELFILKILHGAVIGAAVGYIISKLSR